MPAPAPAPLTAAWRQSDIDAYIARFGLKLDDPAMRARLCASAEAASAAGAAVPRMPNKDCEPAHIFQLPLP